MIQAFLRRNLRLLSFTRLEARYIFALRATLALLFLRCVALSAKIYLASKSVNERGFRIFYYSLCHGIQNFPSRLNDLPSLFLFFCHGYFVAYLVVIKTRKNILHLASSLIVRKVQGKLQRKTKWRSFEKRESKVFLLPFLIKTWNRRTVRLSIKMSHISYHYICQKSQIKSFQL